MAGRLPQTFSPRLFAWKVRDTHGIDWNDPVYHCCDVFATTGIATLEDKGATVVGQHGTQKKFSEGDETKLRHLRFEKHVHKMYGHIIRRTLVRSSVEMHVEH